MTNRNFIASDHSLESYVKDCLAPHWVKAAAAHLTTYSDAQKKGLPYFWNIDADDTEFFASAKNVSDVLFEVEDYVKKNDLDAMSLDMWNSKSRGTHWTFGVSFHKNNNEIENMVMNYGANFFEWFQQKINRENIRNLDWKFTFLRDLQILKLETFCVMDAFYIHWHFLPAENSFPLSGIMYWHDDSCDYPLFPLFYKIPETTVRFNAQNNINALSLELVQNYIGLKQVLEKSQLELSILKNSFSYKLGRKLTWLPRKVRGGFRCLKENGFNYTVKLFFKKLKRKI